MAKILLKLKQFAQAKGKNITEIAQETGLNRNTVTALYHGKVDGIKFDTLEKICDTYDLKINDLLDYERGQKKKEAYYKQEGEVIPFTAWPFGHQSSNLNKDYFEKDYGKAIGYWKGNYMIAYWPTERVTQLAKEVYERYKQPQAMKNFFAEYVQVSSMLESYYHGFNEETFFTSTQAQVVEFFKRLRLAYEKFWGMSLFIDAFDAGFDQQKIKEIAKRYKFTLDEVGLLTTPVEMTFNNERLLELVNLVEAFKKQKKYKKAIDYVNNDTEAIAFRKKFDYYKSNYAFIRHVSQEDMVEEINNWLKDPKQFKKAAGELRSYTKDKQEKIDALLKKKKLKENPLYFFQVLTYWREHRKKVNLMGIHLQFAVLEYLENKTGIKLEYLKFATHDEVEAVLSGLVTQDVLARRYNEGMFVTFEQEGYKMVVGNEAESLRQELDESPETIEVEVINGQVASQGYARGKARIVLNQEDFSKFKEGEILVTSMTRPEYLPIMKIAAAFVTNEGGITCHAAIVARELGKPCIIGTKNATQLIKDGDLIEVRANHGTVRILSRE